MEKDMKKYEIFLANLNITDMKNLTIDEQRKKEEEKDPVTKWMVIIILLCCVSLIIKNLFFN